jgi:hypothetical protein
VANEIRLVVKRKVQVIQSAAFAKFLTKSESKHSHDLDLYFFWWLIIWY